MAKNFGVSATPVRDALNKLVEDELVTVRPRVGFFIVKFTKNYVSEIYEIRKMIECFALINNKNHNFEKYRRFLGQALKIKNIISRPEAYGEFVILDRKIHLNLIKEFGNKQLKKMFFNIYSKIQISQNLGFHEKYLSVDLDQIISFLEKMVSKEILKAEVILKEHLEDSERIGMQSFEEK